MTDTVRVTEPRGGLPTVTVTDVGLDQVCQHLLAGRGPVAIDAERASGFRYASRAYLVQLRRVDGGTHLIDPTAFDDLGPLHQALTGVEWIVHAASQDLVCLAELNLRPTSDLFDTELAGRLLGLPRVGLGPLVEAYLGVSLAKEHSAADWSQRPLPDSWLAYAALDVEFLPELWELMAADLVDAGKFEYALQEFAHVRDTTITPVRSDPWRRTSGTHKLHRPADLAVVRELWLARDQLAAQQDVAPGRILTDAAIVALASARTDDRHVLSALPELAHRNARRHRALWVETTVSARALPVSEHPTTAPRSVGVPAPRAWAERNPQAFARLEAMRTLLGQMSELVSIPVENLMTPDIVRRMLWDPPSDEEALDTALSDLGARPWQRDLLAPLFAEVLEF